MGSFVGSQKRTHNLDQPIHPQQDEQALHRLLLHPGRGDVRTAVLLHAPRRGVWVLFKLQFVMVIAGRNAVTSAIKVTWTFEF